MKKSRYTPKIGTKAARAQRALRNVTTINLTPYASALVASAKPQAKPRPAKAAPRYQWREVLPFAEAIKRANLKAARPAESGEGSGESPAMKARRVRGESDASAGRKRLAPLAARFLGSRRWPLAQRIGAACALIQGALIHAPQGEHSLARKVRAAMPSGSAEAQAAMRKRRALAPHLSPRESALYERRALATLAALPRADESASAEAPARPAWLFATHLSPREQARWRGVMLARRKRAARGAIGAPLVRAGLGWQARDESARRAKARGLRWQRARKHRAGALRLERLAEKSAGACAGQRARFYFMGASAIIHRETGAKIGRKVARSIGAPIDCTEGGEFSLDFREGTGRPLERQAREEMHLAARAVFLARGAWKAANSAAYQEMTRALREPSFTTLGLPSGTDAGALRIAARDRHERRAGAAWQSESASGDANTIQPSAGECLAESDAEAEAPARKLIFAKRKRARLALRAYWRAKKSNAARGEHTKDLRALREIARQQLDGARALVAFRVHRAASAEEKAAKREAQRATRLARRVKEGSETIAALARWQGEARQVTRAAHQAKRAASAPRQAAPSAPALLTLPRGFAENWLGDLSPAQRANVERLLAASAARRAPHKPRKVKAAPAQAARFPLAAPAQAALGDWSPSRAK